FLQHTPLGLLHALNDRLAQRATSEFVRFRQQRSFARNFLDLSGESDVLQKTRYDLLGRQPFRNGKRVLHDAVLDDRLDDLRQTRVLRELVFAALEATTRLEHQHAAHEHQWLIDHALTYQHFRNILDAEPARNVDDLVLRERTRRLKPLPADPDRAANGDGEHDEHRENSVADDHQRMAHPARAAC